MSDTQPSGGSPRDRYISVYGRRPVLAVLADRERHVAKVHLADTAEGSIVDEITELAGRRKVVVERVTPARVHRISGNGKHDQGVVADIVAPRMGALDSWLSDAPEVARVLVLDGVTTPANVGMILRTAVAAGIDGIIVPHTGVSEIGPLVIKASAGVAFAAPILRSRTAVEALTLLKQHGFRIYGLDAEAPTSLYGAEFARRAAFCLGAESVGLSSEVTRHVQVGLSIPMRGGVESVNVATAAAVVSFELLRRAQLSAER